MAQAVRALGAEELSVPRETIFALSSGSPPAAIAVVRISGPHAHAAAALLTPTLPPPRQATLRTLRRPGDGAIIDRALVLRFDAPASSTGEDMVELHLHGGRAVVDAMLVALAGVPGLRAAEAGEFTRRAFESGQIDLIEAEGLADLLTAETEAERVRALEAAEGHVSRRVEGWRGRILAAEAAIEAALEFAEDEGIEVSTGPARAEVEALAAEFAVELARPTVERLRDATVVVLAGPVNSGKSSLFNALLRRDAAIVSATPGTTRDRIEADVIVGGRAYRLVDTAGWRDDATDAIEREGIVLGRRAAEAADILLWLGDGDAPDVAGDVVPIWARADERGSSPEDSLAVSIHEGRTVDQVWEVISQTATAPAAQRAWNERQRTIIVELADALSASHDDPLLIAEVLRHARGSIDRLTGRGGVEDMLDTLFGRFCIGK